MWEEVISFFRTNEIWILGLTIIMYLWFGFEGLKDKRRGTKFFAVFSFFGAFIFSILFIVELAN